MKKPSAGILVFRRKDNKVETLLIHPGGPFWAKKDIHSWSIPKGEYEEDEDPFAAAQREFEEEIGQKPPEGTYIELGSIKQTSGKVVTIWAVEKDLGKIIVSSNTFTMEWPPKSGQKQEFPEVDRAEWFDIYDASQKLHKGQTEFLTRLAEKLDLQLDDNYQEPNPSQQPLF